MRALAVIALVAGCIDVAGVHRCTGDEDCIRDGVGGRCETSRLCSFADATCGGEGFRYHDGAGDHANICVVSGTAVSSVNATELVKDATETSCGTAGTRDAYFEINSPGQQVVFIDTAEENTNIAATIAVRMGPCPGTTELGCLAPRCDSLPYGQLATMIGSGTSCIVVEEGTPGTNGARVGLRVAPAGRPAQPLPIGVPMPGSTCDQPNNQAAYILGACPGTTRVVAMVDPVEGESFDVALSMHTLIPQGPLVGLPVNDAAGSAPEALDVTVSDPGAYWLLVAGVGGPACGQFAVASSISR